MLRQLSGGAYTSRTATLRLTSPSAISRHRSYNPDGQFLRSLASAVNDNLEISTLSRDSLFVAVAYHQAAMYGVKHGAPDATCVLGQEKKVFGKVLVSDCVPGHPKTAVHPAIVKAFESFDRSDGSFESDAGDGAAIVPVKTWADTLRRAMIVSVRVSKAPATCVTQTCSQRDSLR